MEPVFTLDELAVMTDVALERLHEWQALGLLLSDSTRPLHEEAERVRMISFAVEHGIDAEEVARVCTEQGDLLQSFVEQLRSPGRDQPVDASEAAAMVGLSPERLERIWIASGLVTSRRSSSRTSRRCAPSHGHSSSVCRKTCSSS